MSFLPPAAQQMFQQAQGQMNQMMQGAGFAVAEPIAVQLERANEAMDAGANAAAAAATGPLASVMGQKLKYEWKKSQDASRVQSEQAEAASMGISPYLLNVSSFVILQGIKDGKPANIGYFCVQACRRPQAGMAPMVEFETWKRFGDFKDVHNLLKHYTSDSAFNLLNGADTVTKIATGGLFPSGGMPWADKASPQFLQTRMTQLNAWLAQITAFRTRAVVQNVIRDFTNEGKGRNAQQQYESWTQTKTFVDGMKRNAQAQKR